MNKWLFLLFIPFVALGQPVPPPATQTEVNAGLNKFKYVTPFTLNGWTVGGATGAVTVAQLNSASNAIVTILIANDTTTSNGVFTTETTRNAAVSNALVTLLVANDTITSNGAVAFSMTASNNLYTTETTRNAAVSNSIVTLLVANDTTTSNGIVTLLVASDTTTSNGLTAFTMTASNNIYTLETTRNAAVSNSVISYLLGVAVTNGDTRTTWINNLNVGNNLHVTNTAFVDLDLTVYRNFVVGSVSTFSNNVQMQLGLSLTGGLSVDDIFMYGTMNDQSTNLIHTLTEDASPANGDYVMTEDLSSGRLKKVSLGNLPGGSGAGEANVTGEASVTNSTRMGWTYGKAGVTNLLRSIQAGFGAALTNQTGGTNIMVAVDNAIIPSQTQLTTASNALVTVAGNQAAGGSGAIQFAEGTTLAGTNLAVKFLFDRTNTIIKLLNSAPESLNLGVNWVVSNPNGLNLGGGGITNWTIGASSHGHLIPNGAAANDIGSSANRIRTNWITDLDAGSKVILRDPSTVNSGRGTLFGHPSDWKVTNLFVLMVTNPATRQKIGISSASVSGGLNTIILTNEPIDPVGSGMFLRTTNMWADGGVSSLYSNIFTANAGGVSNILATNILDGQTIHVWLEVDPGVTVTLPQFTATNYTDGAIVGISTNNTPVHIEIFRMGNRTNIQIYAATMELLATNGIQFQTNYAANKVYVATMPVVYVTNFPGFDGNAGTKASPVSTLERAYSLTGDRGTIELLSGNGNFTNLNFRATNRVVNLSANGLANIYNGSNVTAFTLVSGTTYSFTAISNAWGSNNTGLNIGGPVIYEMNSQETFIGLANRYPQEFMHNYGLRFCYRLTNCQSLANLAAASTGCYFPSNDVNGNFTIFMKFSDNTVPGTRTVFLPTRSPTNCLVWGGAAGGRVTVSGINVFGAYNGADVSGLDYYEDNNVTYACSTDSGIYSSDLSATIKLTQSAYLANNNDGISLTTGGDRTNINSAFVRRCWIGWNNDEGSSVHYGGPIDHELCLIEYNGQGGFTPYAGGRMTDNGSIVRKNGYGVYLGGGPITINGGWTNFPTHFYGVGTKFMGNTFGMYWESGQSNALFYLKNCALSNNVLDFAITPSTTAQYGFIEDCTLSLNGGYRQSESFTNPVVIGNVYLAGPLGNVAQSQFPATVTAAFVAGCFTNTFTNDVVLLMGHGSATGARTNRLPDAGIVQGMIVKCIDTVNTAGNSSSNVWVETTSGQLINTGIVRTNMTRNGGSITLQATFCTGVAGWRILER